MWESQDEYEARIDAAIRTAKERYPLGWTKKTADFAGIVSITHAPGFKIQGRLEGVRQPSGDGSPIATITGAACSDKKWTALSDNYDAPDAKERRVSFFLPSALRRVFDDIEVGTEIRVTYLGTATSKKGREFHNFEVEVNEDNDDVPF